VNQTQLMAVELPAVADRRRMSEAQAGAEQVREISRVLAAIPQRRTAAQLTRLTPAELRRAGEPGATVSGAVGIAHGSAAQQMQARRIVDAALGAGRERATLDLLKSPPVTAPAPSPRRRGLPVEPLPRRQRGPAPAPPPAPGSSGAPVPTADRIAQRRMHGARVRVLTFLARAGLHEDREHLLAIEERLHHPGAPARHHAALSTRLLLKGVADHCFRPRAEPWISRSGRRFEVAEKNVGHRLIAFVEGSFGAAAVGDDIELRLFVAQVDALARFGGRGPHRIYRPDEGERHLLRLLEVLDRVAWVHRTATLPAPATG
jgi:hypothetical protein